MNFEKNCLIAVGKSHILIRYLMAGRKKVNAILCAILLASGLAPAQTGNFNQTGQIRTIVTETKPSLTKDSMPKPGAELSGDAASITEFYFTYSALENGVYTEKWVSLPGDKTLGLLSNQPVKVSGSLKNNKLLNVKVSPLNSVSEKYLTAPPPTIGLYKLVSVPLTIPSQSAPAKSEKQISSSGVTPEAIRNNLFNAPDAVNKFYLEASYGMFGFTGVHHPQTDVVPVTIQAAVSSNCQEQHDQLVNQFTPIIQQRLREQSIDTSNGSVDLAVVVFSDMPGCSLFPFATRGALGQRGAPQWVWIPESWFVTGPLIIAHEIGHALGGNHPLAQQCTDLNNPQTCVYVDAVDRDIMTSGGRYYMMPNNYERRRWGWHPPGAFDNPSNAFSQMFDLRSPALPFVKDGETRGRFYFRNLGGAYSGWDIYPEARQNWGQFEKYKGLDEPFRLGIALRIGHSNYGDPEALSIIIDPNGTSHLEDAPLRENQQVSIGETIIKCTREHNPNWGTRMRIQE
jgi:hypothetical protein